MVISKVLWEFWSFWRFLGTLGHFRGFGHILDFFYRGFCFLVFFLFVCHFRGFFFFGGGGGGESNGHFGNFMGILVIFLVVRGILNIWSLF